MKSDNFFAILGAIILCVCIILCIAFPDEMFNSDTPRYNTTSKDIDFDFQYETLETIEPFDFEYIEPLTTTEETTNDVVYIVYITDYGSKYHRSWCGSLWDSCYSISYNDAIASGYEPCERCNP